MFLFYRLFKVVFLFSLLTACDYKKPIKVSANTNQPKSKFEYLTLYLTEVQNFDSSDIKGTIIIINNLGCSSCSINSLEEMKLDSNYRNTDSKLIILAQRDSSYQESIFNDCINCEFIYDKGLLSKYGLLESFPHIYKIANNEIHTSMKFYGRKDDK